MITDRKRITILTRRLNAVRNTASTAIQCVLSLQDRVDKLERHSHPPVTFEVCSICGALTAIDNTAQHAEWHGTHAALHKDTLDATTQQP